MASAITGMQVQLNFSRDRLVELLRMFAFLTVLFMGALAVSPWIHGPRGILLFGSSLMAFPVAFWCLAKAIWLVRSEQPAAVATERGIEIHGFTGRRNVPWDQIDAVGEAELETRKTKLAMIEIRRRGGRPIRVPVPWLSNSQAEIDRWIAAAQSRLAT